MQCSELLDLCCTAHADIAVAPVSDPAASSQFRIHGADGGKPDRTALA